MKQTKNERTCGTAPALGVNNALWTVRRTSAPRICHARRSLSPRACAGQHIFALGGLYARCAHARASACSRSRCATSRTRGQRYRSRTHHAPRCRALAAARRAAAAPHLHRSAPCWPHAIRCWTWYRVAPAVSFFIRLDWRALVPRGIWRFPRCFMRQHRLDVCFRASGALRRIFSDIKHRQSRGSVLDSATAAARLYCFIKFDEYVESAHFCAHLRRAFFAAAAASLLARHLRAWRLRSAARRT